MSEISGSAENSAITQSSWSALTINAVLNRLEEDSSFKLCEIRLQSVESFSIIFAAPWLEGLFGLYLDGSLMLSEDAYPSVEASDVPIRMVSPDQLAFDIVHLMIGEPFDDADVSKPDQFGIRWLHLSNDP